MRCVRSEDDITTFLDFSFDDTASELLAKILNQRDSTNFSTYSFEKKFTNVWDREHIYIHSSISDDYNQFLCENNARYQPREYVFPAKMPSIQIWFTSDFKNKLVINNAALFVLKLTFMLNYRTAAI